MFLLFFMECHSLGMFDNKKAGAPFNIISGCLDWNNTNHQVRWFILMNNMDDLDEPTIHFNEGLPVCDICFESLHDKIVLLSCEMAEAGQDSKYLNSSCFKFVLLILLI